MNLHCPICGTEVEEGPQAPRADHGGRTFLFCSEECRALFLQYPESFTEERAEDVKVLEDTGF
jgi:YHS domain-containing protein